MKRKLITLALVIAVLATALVPIALPFAQIRAQGTSPFTDIPVTGSLPGGGTFSGTLDITKFVIRDDALVAKGRLTGTLTDALGNVIGSVTNDRVLLPVASLQATCDILHLELGPLDLDLLGLVVHLDQVVLDIDAALGPGNLLGNLLCAITGLLDSPLKGLRTLLNLILTIF